MDTGSTGPDDCPKFIKCPQTLTLLKEFSKVSFPTESKTLSTPLPFVISLICKHIQYLGK